MPGEFLDDLLALARSVPLAGAVPRIRRRAGEYVAEYRRVVAPMVASALGPSLSRRYDDAMCESGVKVGFMLAAYAATANVPYRADVAMLGTAITRVYDDLIDDDGDDDLVRRISDLFAGNTFSPACPLERLFADLYLELERRLGRGRDDPIYAALIALHEAQVRSRRQRDPAISSSVLLDITRDKGGHATVVLYALMKPAMSDRELLLVRELGALLQFVDDYLDIAADRAAGITTSATRAELTFSQICRQLCDLRRDIRACYGREQPLCAVIYLYLWLGFFRRRLPRRLTTDTEINVLVSLARV